MENANTYEAEKNEEGRTTTTAQALKAFNLEGLRLRLFGALSGALGGMMRN